MTNEYYKKSVHFQEKLKEYASNIFKTYGKELVLRLEEYNLLQNKHNCIETSTAIGFVIEEFIVSKLEMYTHCDEESEYIIDRYSTGTTSESYDCYSIKDDLKFMVNIKAEKNKSANDAIAAIGQLHRNYCEEEPTQQKSYIIFKVKYSIKEAEEETEFRRAKPRCIYINGLETYNLETVDFSDGYRQDNRSWSANTEGKSTKNNGRLQISNKFREDHIVAEEEVSYEKTYDMLDNIFNGNK